jgi:hypothetical protein
MEDSKNNHKNTLHNTKGQNFIPRSRIFALNKLNLSTKQKLKCNVKRKYNVKDIIENENQLVKNKELQLQLQTPTDLKI